jgi:murein L,D-transpeptidase YcbB/YkuD
MVAPERAADFGALSLPPLVEIEQSPRSDVAAPAGLFADAPRQTNPQSTASGPIAGPAALPASEPRSAGAAPDPTTTALALALDRLILRDERSDPLGAGDWRAARAGIGAFYAARGFAPIWVDANGLTPAGRSALGRLALASTDGLTLGAYAPPAIAGPLTPQAIAEAEVRIAAAIVVYADQAGGSRVAPWRVSSLIASEAAIPDAASALGETADAADAGARLADFNPPQKGYRQLREELRRLSDTGPGVAQRGLERGSDLLASADDAEAVAKIARPRLRRLARATSADSLSDERATILANMEMWRWEPRDMGERRIEVNIPDFTVAVMDGDEVLHRARVVVGKPTSPTPVFSNLMRYVVINPSWHVPESIIKKEMLSKLGYLSSHGYEVKTVNGRLTVRQLPGERNALGRLAFMFPNDYAVYLHDTPSRELFDDDVRAFSHGCIRVEDPERLAEIVLDWPEERITKAIGGKERAVYLPKPLPVHIEYFTAFVDEYGDLQERTDLYGLAHKVAGILSSLRQD